MCLNGIREVCVYDCLCLSVCERVRWRKNGEMHFVFMQIHLGSSLGIMWKLKMEKCNVTGAERWMNTPHKGKYPHVQTHITHTVPRHLHTRTHKLLNTLLALGAWFIASARNQSQKTAKDSVSAVLCCNFMRFMCQKCSVCTKNIKWQWKYFVKKQARAHLMYLSLSVCSWMCVCVVH